jgi:hypothetical protein
VIFEAPRLGRHDPRQKKRPNRIGVAFVNCDKAA